MDEIEVREGAVERKRVLKGVRQRRRERGREREGSREGAGGRYKRGG